MLTRGPHGVICPQLAPIMTLPIQGLPSLSGGLAPGAPPPEGPGLPHFCGHRGACLSLCHSSQGWFYPRFVSHKVSASQRRVGLPGASGSRP